MLLGCLESAAVTPRNGDQAFGILGQPVTLDQRNAGRLTLGITLRNQPGEIAITLIIHDQQGESLGRHALLRLTEPKITADNRLNAGTLCGLIELDHRKQIHAIGQRNRRHIQLFGLRCQRFAIDTLSRLDPNQAVADRVLGM